jgi:1,4-alpha-glucan branching enzyme
LDYSRKEGEWLPNRYGGRENLEAIEFLRATNHAVHEEFPGCMTVAEESTAWPGVTRPTVDGGLGFTFKWNMGWMHDTLAYFSKDPVHRRFHHDQLTFAMLYEHTERFVMPLSHDEVVHGKRSLLEKMPGDLWQKFANLRLLLTYQFTRPGKKLLFMGTELAPYTEWNHDGSLEWHWATDDWRKGLSAFMEALGRVYQQSPCLWIGDHDPTGFAWIDCSDRDNSVLCYWRRAHDNHLIVVLNLTPVPRDDYRIGAPFPGRYVQRLSSDDGRFAGSGFRTNHELWAESIPYHGYEQSLRLRLPPLSALILQPVY